jgi:uncharacterized membrane protein
MKSLSAPLFDFRKSFFLRTEMDRLLTSSMCFSCMLVIVRIVHSGRLLFIFMIWNLFLAYIPYALSTWLKARYSIPDGRWPEASRARLPEVEGSWWPGFRVPGLGGAASPELRRRGSRLLLIVLSLVWLLFIPNTFYILTDLYHLTDHGRTSRIPEWYDLVLILSFAWNGLLLGVLSVRHMEKLFMPRASVLAGWLFVYPIMMLNALGVYTGRYLRYNSWDIISDPFELLADILDMIIHPFRNHPVWMMILCFSILLTLIYRMFRGSSKALA